MLDSVANHNTPHNDRPICRRPSPPHRSILSVQSEGSKHLVGHVWQCQLLLVLWLLIVAQIIKYFEHAARRFLEYSHGFDYVRN